MAKTLVKAKIWYIAPHWYSQLPTGLVQEYILFDAAAFSIKSYYESKKRYLKAQDIIFKLKDPFLSVNELSLIDSINITNKCNKKQYGWLKGILERQNP